MRAAIYTRISLDPNHDSWSPDRQEILCRNLADARGFEVTEVFTDRDASAWRAKVERPGCDALKTAVERGAIDVVMAYSLTRLGRRVRDLLDLSEFLKSHQCALAVVDMSLDTTTPGGLLIYTVIAALAQLESEQISVRVKSAQSVMAHQGRMPTGGKRHFGYNRDTTVNQREADAIRAAVEQLRSGASLGSCATQLNRAGIATSDGFEWSGTKLSRTLKSSRLAGIRIYNGQQIKGTWEAIVPEGQWAELQAIIAARPDRGNGVGRPRHLLAGLIYCGRCGAAMYRHHHSPTRTNRPIDSYLCITSPGRPGCGRVRVSEKSTDKAVLSRFITLMSSARPREQGAGIVLLSDMEEELARAAATISEVTERQYLTQDPKLPDQSFAELITKLTARSQVLRTSIQMADAGVDAEGSSIGPGSPEQIKDWWSLAPPTHRRVALGRAIEKIVIHPSVQPKGSRFDDRRVEVKPSTLWYSYSLPGLERALRMVK